MRVIRVLTSVCAVLGVAAWSQVPASSRHLLLVVDGLRPDYVTPAVMPRLTALGRRGVVFTRHHAVYPTVTRVNAASFSTGAYPERHGLMGNTVFFPAVNQRAFLDTSDREQLLSIANTEDRLLTAPTLGEWLQAAGQRMLVVSSGSPGSAFLNNHTVAGGAILHPQFAMPGSLADSISAAGPPPPPDAPATDRDRYAVDLFLKVGLPRVDPAVTVLWLGALDSTAHDRGIGAPETIEVLRGVDGLIERVESGLTSAGALDRYNIWVTSDHGFSTYTGGTDVRPVLTPHEHAMADGAPRLVASGGAIYLRDRDPGAIATIVAGLQRLAGIGAIFTRPSSPGALDGVVPGTLSFDAVRWNHSRAADVLFSPDWSDQANRHGMPGSAASAGTAGHGSSSPWDVHNTAMAAGPDLRRGVTLDAPSANVDFAPTFLATLGLPISDAVQGRVLGEAMVSGQAVAKTRIHEHVVRTADGRYVLTGRFSTVTVGSREYRYFDGTTVVRSP